MANSDSPARGAAFEDLVRRFFERRGLVLDAAYSVEIGAGSVLKPRKFDLGCLKPATLVERKSHTWTGGQCLEREALSVERGDALLLLAPKQYRKIPPVRAALARCGPGTGGSCSTWRRMA